MKHHIIGLYTAIYHVQDLARAKEWYATLLGTRPYFDEPFYVGFNVAGHELGLLPAGPAPRPEHACVAYWGVKDIAAATAVLTGRGHVMFEPVTDVGGDIKVATLLDSEGNLVGLIENPHFPNPSGM